MLAELNGYERVARGNAPVNTRPSELARGVAEWHRDMCSFFVDWQLGWLLKDSMATNANPSPIAICKFFRAPNDNVLFPRSWVLQLVLTSNRICGTAPHARCIDAMV